MNLNPFSKKSKIADIPTKNPKNGEIDPKKTEVKKKRAKLSKMRLGMLVYIGYRNLRSSKLRSFLTIGGVAIGIGIITILICLGFGVQKLVVSEVTKNNSIDVVDISNSNLENFIVINDESIEKLKAIPGVEKIAALMNTGGKVYWADSQTDSIIYGTNQEYLEMANVKFANGNAADWDPEGSTAAISARLAKFLGFANPADALGKELEFDMVLSSDIAANVEKDTTSEKGKLKVVGVIADEQSTYLYLPLPYLQKNLGISGAQSGKLKIDVKNIGEIRAQVEQMGFVTESVVDLVNDINSFFTIIRVAMIVLGTIIMSISAMGMLNTLSVSLLQRTKEVGILKALGAKRKDIFKMFVFEAAIISFLGGAIGFMGGYATAYVINVIFNLLAIRSGHSTLNFIFIPSYFVVAIVIFIFFLGLVTGLMPARRASRIHALDALRYE
ncbi:MAG: FtsX-like permease family protein [Parcubacteria group bacterium]|jgi:ABC-type antimicrobial peptide transport system permease subunit